MDDACPQCRGTGTTQMCPHCGGCGLLGVTHCYERDCDACGGTGRVAPHACLLCRPPASHVGETAPPPQKR